MNINSTDAQLIEMLINDFLGHKTELRDCIKPEGVRKLAEIRVRIGKFVLGNLLALTDDDKKGLIDKLEKQFFDDFPKKSRK